MLSNYSQNSFHPDPVFTQPVKAQSVPAPSISIPASDALSNQLTKQAQNFSTSSFSLTKNVASEQSNFKEELQKYYCCWSWFIIIPIRKGTAECFKDKFNTQMEGKRGMQHVTKVLSFNTNSNVTRNVSSTKITVGKKRSTLNISKMITRKENSLHEACNCSSKAHK